MTAAASIGVLAGLGIRKLIKDKDFEQAREKIYFSIYDTMIALNKQIETDPDMALERKQYLYGLLALLDRYRLELASDMGLRTHIETNNESTNS